MAKPSVPASAPVILAGTLLSVQAVETLVLSGEKGMVIIGREILRELEQRAPQAYYSFLWEPCSTIAWSVSRISYDEPLSRVLDEFRGANLGVVSVHRGDIETLLNLSDFLPLYAKGLLSTDLKVSEVASPIHRVPPTLTIKEALRHILRLGFRRLFLDKGVFVSDRHMVRFLFSPEALLELRDSPERVMEHTLEELGPSEALELNCDTTVVEASRLIRPGTLDCLVLGERVATPWDLLVKPLVLGRMAISPKMAGDDSMGGPAAPDHSGEA